MAPVHHMGGGPRTYPGGVTKWQWRRMQLKKSRQIEKARLLREKHIYEARRRAELLAASPVLEMPWQKMSRVRPPNYVTADEQVTKLAARFERRGAEDLWTEKDGPESFEILNDESFSQISTTMARNQDTSHWKSQNSATDEQWNSPSRVGDGQSTFNYQSFRHRPTLRHGSISHLEPSDRRVSRRPQTQSDQLWNRVQNARTSSYSQYTPRIRPGPTSHPEPFYKERPRGPHG